MDKQFWISITENNYTLPEGHSIQQLTDELCSYLGSTDAELRDTLGLEIFYNWLIQGQYSLDELRGLVQRLLANLQIDIGAIGNDSVFLRSFSALWLSNILAYDQDKEKPEFGKEDVAPILAAALAHFTAEHDIRGYVPVKGYAHAMAHSADLLGALAASPHTDAGDHLKILDCIANKLRDGSLGIYLYNEDGRIARPVIGIFKRNLLTLDQIEAWSKALCSDWNGAWQDEARTRAYYNGRNLLRALYLYILLLEGDELPNKEALLKLLQDRLVQARPWEWAVA